MTDEDIKEQLNEIHRKLSAEDDMHHDIIEKQALIGTSITAMLEQVLRHERNIDTHTGHLKDLVESTKEIQETLEALQPMEDLAQNVKTISDFGGLFWRAVKWLAVLIGGVTLIAVALKEGLKA